MTLIAKGWIMSGNRIVAAIDNDIVTVTDKQRCPLFLLKNSSVKDWLADRAFDTTRGHSRTLKRAAKMTSLSDAEVALRFYGATVTDNYWVRTSDNGALTYEEIRFKTDHLFRMALNGDLSELEDASEESSPQFTVSGCLEKGWTIETLFDAGGLDSRWVLYKQENSTEKFNEMFVSDLSEALGIPSAEYYPTGTGIKTPSFAEGYNFEDMAGVIGDNYADYGYVYDTIKDMFGKNAAEDYVRLLYADAVSCNVDRHSKNFGVLRDPDTGAFVSMAPNYDYNQSVFGNGLEVNSKPEVKADLLITDLVDLIRDKDIDISLPEIKEKELREATKRNSEHSLYEDAVSYVLGRQCITHILLSGGDPSLCFRTS